MKWKRYSVTLDGHTHSPRFLTSRNAIESSQARAIIIAFASTKVHLFSTYLLTVPIAYTNHVSAFA